MVDRGFQSSNKKDGFRACLQEATRGSSPTAPAVDHGNDHTDVNRLSNLDHLYDWSVHTVDYHAFQTTLLRPFARRRAKIRALFRRYDNKDRVPALELHQIFMESRVGPLLLSHTGDDQQSQPPPQVVVLPPEIQAMMSMVPTTTSALPLHSNHVGAAAGTTTTISSSSAPMAFVRMDSTQNVRKQSRRTQKLQQQRQRRKLYRSPLMEEGDSTTPYVSMEDEQRHQQEEELSATGVGAATAATPPPPPIAPLGTSNHIDHPSMVPLDLWHENVPLDEKDDVESSGGSSAAAGSNNRSSHKKKESSTSGLQRSSSLSPPPPQELRSSNLPPFSIPRHIFAPPGDGIWNVSTTTPTQSAQQRREDNTNNYFFHNRPPLQPQPQSHQYWLKRRVVMRHLSNWERNDVITFLATEMDKVAMFYLAQWQKLSAKLLELQSSILSTYPGAAAAASSTTSSSLTILDQQLWLGKEILELHAFCAMNIVTVRQILIRYDGFALAHEGTPMMHYYMKMIQSKPSATSFRKILRHKEVWALGTSYVDQLDKLGLKWNDPEDVTGTMSCQFVKEQSEIDAVVEASQQAEATGTLGHAPRTTTYRQHFHRQYHHNYQYPRSLRRHSSSSDFSSTRSQPLCCGDSFLDHIRQYLVLGMLQDRLGYEPSYLVARGRSLTDEMKRLVQWRRKSDQQWTRAGMFQTPEDLAALMSGPTSDGPTSGLESLMGSVFSSDQGNDAIKGSDTRAPDDQSNLSRQEIYNLALCLASAGMYCLNYYIVEPSSTMYVNALGAPDAISALLIGMMPIASFLAAIVYSVWTNTSFRRPFLVSCSLMLVGNIIYSAAFNFKSLPMALIGRFLTGLGGPKCIIRRYMADTTSISIRTSVNALFGMVVAAGSALGPGCAILLNRLDFVIALPGGAELWFNGMTGPGWFMALLWTIFSLCLFTTFKELDRIGLREQMQKEGMGNQKDGLISGGDVGYTKNNGEQPQQHSTVQPPDDDMATIKSTGSMLSASVMSNYDEASIYTNFRDEDENLWQEFRRVLTALTFPVRICLGLLFCKVFVIETLVSCTSTLSKNRYGWTIHEVGLLGCVNGLFVIPLSIMVGRLSMSYQDRMLMVCLLAVGIAGLSLLIDFSDLFHTAGDSSSHRYNAGHFLAVGPGQYVIGYFFTYISIQSFEGVIGSALSKVIPTTLATGTFNSGLLATLVDTSGRFSGDVFISVMATINLRQLMNLLFIPGVLILCTCLMVVRRHYDLLAV